jgi:23S rRNA (pseudouridine1915-N3)-methyltransferase
LRFKIISVGRERSDPAAPLVKDYVSRINKFVPIEDIVFPDERADRLTKRILKEIQDSKMVVALDERGKSYDSLGFSRWVDSWMNHGITKVSFVVGGAEGLLPEIKGRADALLALSRMTLPHRLARLVLVEQLYRACCIIRGTPYQK